MIRGRSTFRYSTPSRLTNKEIYLFTLLESECDIQTKDKSFSRYTAH